MANAKRWAPWMVVLLFGVTVGGCVVGKNPLTGKKRPYAFSWEQERELGAEADKQVLAQFGEYEDPQLLAYVRRVGAEVLEKSHLRREDADPSFRETPFTFRVLDSEVVNAFALPGGYVYVTRGLLAHLENEAQLAMVLGHEIGHVAGRHAAERAFEQQMGQLGLIGGAILGQEILGLPGGDLLNLGGAAAQLLFLRYSRDDEREADALGVEYASLAGYQAGEGAAFFHSLDRLQEQEGKALPGFLATHPDPGEREETILKMAREWRGRSQPQRVDAEDYLSQLDGVVLGPDPRQGFVDDGVFYHPELRFRFEVPRGFRAINQATQVVMVEEQQQALLGFSLVQAQSATDAARKFASQEGLRVLDTGRGEQNGLRSSFVLAAGQTRQRQVLQARSWYIDYDGRVYGFMGYTAQEVFGRYDDAFLTAMRSFRPLTDPARLSVRPARLETVAAPRTTPFRALLPTRLPEGVTPEDLAILNQLDLGDTVRQGELVKLPALGTAP